MKHRQKLNEAQRQTKMSNLLEVRCQDPLCHCPKHKNKTSGTNHQKDLPALEFQSANRWLLTYRLCVQTLAVNYAANKLNKAEENKEKGHGSKHNLP